MARTITGQVSSKSGNKSIVVTVKTTRLHPLYKKRYSRSTKFMAHDEANKAGVGDLVQIVETRPISKSKRFSLEKILTKAGVAYVAEDSTADVEVEVTGVKDDQTKEQA